MNSINFILRYVIIMLLFSCKSNSKHDSNVKYYESDMGYEDGTYCDEIDYYYSETGTSSTYTLNVEIENNELKVIHWPNNGWLDESHFSYWFGDTSSYYQYNLPSGESEVDN